MKTSLPIVLIILVMACNGQVKNPIAIAPYRISETITIAAPQLHNNLWNIRILLPTMLQRYPTHPQINEHIRRMYQDQSGDIWFGTNDDGVYRFDGEVYEYYTLKDGLGGNAVRGILQDKQKNMWFATNGGLTRFDGKTFINFQVGNNPASNDIWSLCLDRHGVIWIGTMDGLFQFDGTAMKAVELPTTPVKKINSRFLQRLVWSIYEDRAGHIWFGTDGAGLVRYDGQQFTYYTTQQGLCDNNVTSILEDRNGNLWFGTRSGGVSRYSDATFTTYTVSDGLCHTFIWTIYEDRSGAIWFGSAGGGVSRYREGTFQTFRENEGLTRNNVQCILEDKDGELWFGFSGGVFQLSGGHFKNMKRPGC